MISKCVKEGTIIPVHCPIDDFDGSYPINWEPHNLFDYEYYEDYDYSVTIDANFRAIKSDEKQYEAHEITCHAEEQFYHAIIIVTGKKMTLFMLSDTYTIMTDTDNPVLPIQLSLEKGEEANSLTILWKNPTTSSSNVQADYYNYQILVNVTDSYETTFSYSSEVMNPEVRYKGLNLTGLECKHVEVTISLPGNCEGKTASGALLIS